MKLSSHFRRAAVLGLSLLLAAQLGGQQQGKPQHRRAAEMRRKLHKNPSFAKYRKISF